MLPRLADLAAALDREPDPERRALLEGLASTLLRIGVVRWEIAQLAALLCRLTLDVRDAGGDDDGRDACCGMTATGRSSTTCARRRTTACSTSSPTAAPGEPVAPRPAHRRAVVRLLLELSRTCPPEFEVLVAPLDFQPTKRRSLQPDLLVVRKDDGGEHAIERHLLLAVEILSPSTRAKDLLVKRALY